MNKVADKKDRKRAKELVKRFTELEFKLQDAWGFNRDIKYHRFWEPIACVCPKIDNDEAWPLGIYGINYRCILHGQRTRKSGGKSDKQ